MALISINRLAIGVVGVTPGIVFINTTDSLATVTAAGYLNNKNLNGNQINTTDFLCICYGASGASKGWFSASIATATGIITLTEMTPSIALPTIANHIAIYTDVNGSLGEDASTAINGGSIQAGLSGTAGTLSSFPSAVTSGKLTVAAVTNAGGNFNTTISNASSVGQSQVVSIPDSGSATANFLLNRISAGPQHVLTGGLQVDGGSLLAGLAAGGTTGSLTLYPATTANGFLELLAVNAGAAFNTIISNSAMGQTSTISIPDPGAATALFLLSALTGAGVQHVTSGGLQVDGGSLLAGLAAGGTAGSVTLYPPTTANGFLKLLSVNAGANFDSIISNGTMGQTSTYTLPDPANAAARFLVAATATPFVSGNLPQASGTGGLMVDSGIAGSGLQILSAAITLTQAQVQGMYAAPVQIVAAVPTKVIVPVQATIYTNFQVAAFAGGGVGILQYDSTIHGAGTNALSATIPAAEITAAASQIYNLGASVGGALTAITNKGLFLSNQTGAFINGNAASTIVVVVSYYLVTATV